MAQEKKRDLKICDVLCYRASPAVYRRCFRTTVPSQRYWFSPPRNSFLPPPECPYHLEHLFQTQEIESSVK